MRDMSVFNRGEDFNSLIAGKAGLSLKRFNDVGTNSLAVVNIGFTASQFISLALFFSNPILFSLLSFTTDAIGFFLCFATLGIDSGLFVSFRFLLSCNTVTLCLFSSFLLLTFSAFLR